MFEFCQAEKRWQVHYRLVCSTFCSQKAFSKIWLKRNQTILQVLKEDKKHFKMLFPAWPTTKTGCGSCPRNLRRPALPQWLIISTSHRMHLYHVDKKPVIVIPLIRLHTIFMIASHWQLIGRQFSVFPSTLFILCWRRLIASSYRLKTISSPKKPLISSPSGDGQWLVFYVFFMIEIFSLRGGLPRMQSMTLKYLSSG